MYYLLSCSLLIIMKNINNTIFWMNTILYAMLVFHVWLIIFYLTYSLSLLVAPSLVLPIVGQRTPQIWVATLYWHDHIRHGRLSTYFDASNAIAWCVYVVHSVHVHVCVSSMCICVNVVCVCVWVCVALVLSFLDDTLWKTWTVWEYSSTKLPRENLDPSCSGKSL